MSFSSATRKFWTGKDSFAEHRLRTALLAVVIGIASGLALLIGPESGGRLATAWITACAAVFSLALISLIYELFLRQSHAVALNKFLRLNSTIVRSGLQEIDEESDIDWRRLFSASTEMTFVLVAPHQAATYLNAIIREHRNREVHIRFCFPDLPEIANDTDPANACRMSSIAKSIGADNHYASSVASKIEELIRTFDREASQLNLSSTLEVAVYGGPIYCEGVVLERTTVLMPIDAAGRPPGAVAACMIFEHGHSHEINRLRDSLLEVSDASHTIESKKAG